MTVTARSSGGGFDLELGLDQADLLPGRLVDGRARITARGGGEIRGARVALAGVETYRFDRTETDSNGHPQTRTYTKTEDLPLVPIAVLGPTSFGPGETREIPFQLPVPSLGPPSFDATEVKVEWELRMSLDVPLFDPSVVLPVRVLQPTALLRAGVIDVAQFALFPEAAVADDELTGALWLDPMPLVVGAPFQARLTLAQGSARDVQEVRAELRVQAKCTVSGGREETIVLWAGRLAGEGSFGGTAATVTFEGTVPDRAIPTMRTEHGRADATFHIVIAVAWARDPHLVRDVAIASTAEL